MKKSVIAGLIAVLAVGAAMAQVQGVVITKENKQLEGTIRWNPRDKAYAVAQKGNNIELSLEEDMIQDLRIPQPRELITAIESVKKGQGGSAISSLQSVVKKYQKLKWDEVATRYLAEAYLQDGNADKALDVCESLIKGNEQASYIGEMAPVYWEALVKKGRVSKAESLMGQAIKEGDRRASAFAQIRRGDIVLAGGETADNAKKALRDGYLRVVTLYRAVRDAQPEALYKAARCFEKIGQASRADKMRTTLRSEFADSEWAKK